MANKTHLYNIRIPNRLTHHIRRITIRQRDKRGEIRIATSCRLTGVFASPILRGRDRETQKNNQSCQTTKARKSQSRILHWIKERNVVS